MKRAIKYMLLADSWATLAAGMIGPIYAIFVERIGGDLLDASWAYFAFMLTSGIVMYLVAHWEDKVKHKEKLIIAGYCLTALGFLSYIFVDSQAHLILTQVILGLGEAVQLPAFDALYSEYIDKDRKASEWGDWEAMWYIVTAIAAVIGGFIATEFGFKILFMVMFGVSILSIISALALFKKQKLLNSA